MTLSPLQLTVVLVAAFAVLAGLIYLDHLVAASRRGIYRIALAVVVAGAFFYIVQQVVSDFSLSVDVVKGGIALIAAAAVFYEVRRDGSRRPVAERWKRFVGITLALAAVLSYFNGFRNGYEKLYHRHEHYHYYVGAKYFPEMGYDGLYKCTVIAQDELGSYTYVNEDTGRTMRIDMSKEARNPDRKVRNLGDDNLLVPASRFLEHPEQCKSLFSAERWEAFKQDVAFFRASADREYFGKMQLDHGFNPPPVWTIAGKLFADLHPASTGYMQFLASLDMLYLGAMFVALAWAFGWRVSAVAAIFWGCQSSAPMLWTAGAFLRQDWLFYLVLSVCLLRKKYPALAAAALVYSALLRIFPGLLVVGWLAVVFWQLVRHRRLTRQQLRMLGGGVLAASLLVGVSVQMCGKEAYTSFYEHTLKVHDQTPLTNHMGLRVILAQKTPIEIPALGIGVNAESGRMKYAENNQLRDPFDTWKRMRNDRYASLKLVAYAIIALSFAFFLYVTRRMKNMWVALSIAQVFVILLSQLTCYYYSFMILGAPLTKVKPLRRPIELALFGFAFVSQFTFRAFRFNDDKYWMLTLISLIMTYGLVAAFAPSSLWDTIRAKLGWLPSAPVPQSPAEPDKAQ